MKFVPIICLALIFATPAFAAPQWVETACWKAANRVLLVLGAREKGSLYCQLHSRLDGWNAAAPGPQEL